MYIAVQHTISYPEKFWEEGSLPDKPEGVTLHSVLPNADGSLCNCLWEADSISAVRTYLEEHLGAFSTNTYYEVKAEKAMGLPE